MIALRITSLLPLWITPTKVDSSAHTFQIDVPPLDIDRQWQAIWLTPAP